MVNFRDEREFLKEAKSLVSSGKRDFIKRTYDNHPSGTPVRWFEALGEIGLTDPNQVWGEVLQLSPGDFIEGPVLDRDRPRDGEVIWVFKKEVNGTLTYIKLKIDDLRGCVCLSFHKDW